MSDEVAMVPRFPQLRGGRGGRSRSPPVSLGTRVAACGQSHRGSSLRCVSEDFPPRLDERPSSLACRLRASPQTKRQATGLSTSECSPIVRSPTPCTSCPYRLVAVVPAARWGTCIYIPTYVGGLVRPIVCTAWCVNFAFPWGGESYTPSTPDDRPDNLTNSGVCVCEYTFPNRGPCPARRGAGLRRRRSGASCSLRIADPGWTLARNSDFVARTSRRFNGPLVTSTWSFSRAIDSLLICISDFVAHVSET